MSPFAEATELTIDAEWDNMCDIISAEQELPSSTKEEVSKVLEEWTSDEESVDLDIMDVDEQIGSNFLSDELFGGVTCPSPVSPQEEFMQVDIDADKFLCLPNDNNTKSSAPLDPKYLTAYQKLQESMRRSQESRKALSMKSDKATDAYDRRKSIGVVLSEIERSGQQLQSFFGPMVSA